MKVGWVEQPDQRGTYDIIWSCLLLLISSTWTVLHINVPAAHETYGDIVSRKARWAVFCLLAPEMVTVLSGLQWKSARDSMQLMSSLNAGVWTVVHGFFADSGGFLLCPPDTPPFPVNSRAIHYLVQQKYISMPAITQAEIEDRSKADIFVKTVACVQGGYMIAQCIARPVQNLEVSCLELSTVAYVVCTAVTYLMLIHKPLGVEKAVRIEMHTSMCQVLLNAGQDAANPYEDTPMDFVEQPGWKAWRRRPRFAHWAGLSRRPIDRVPNDYISQPESIIIPMFMWVVISVYGALHILGWNFAYPTQIDMWIWRISSLVSFAVLFSWGFAENWTAKPWFNFDMTVLGVWEKKSTKSTFWRRWALDGPGTCSAILYFVARMLLIGEMFASLRSMDSTAYQNVKWTDFVPHL